MKIIGLRVISKNSHLLNIYYVPGIVFAKYFIHIIYFHPYKNLWNILIIFLLYNE